MNSQNTHTHAQLCVTFTQWTFIARDIHAWFELDQTGYAEENKFSMVVFLMLLYPWNSMKVTENGTIMEVIIWKFEDTKLKGFA